MHTQEPEYDVPPLPPKVIDETPLPNEPEDLANFDDITQYTQHTRLRMVRQMSKKLHEIEDPKQATVLLKALSDMDKAVVNKRRLGIEEEAQKTADQQQRNVADLLRGINTQMFQAANTGDPAARPAPKLSSAIAPPQLVPGEVDVGTASHNYEDFVRSLPEHQEANS